MFARSIVAIILPFLLSPICFPVSAQSQSANARLRQVSAEEGDAIVQAAWELRRGLIPKPDCSHFVHAVYAHAGFLYEFAASRAVFAGIDHFRRVQKPQPGDLVVWQGHIGIVIDPQEHSFYSSVLSGFAIENYRSNYWVRRGNPRFYRFVVHDSQSTPSPVLFALTKVLPGPEQTLLGFTQLFPASNWQPGLMVGGQPDGSGQESARVETEAGRMATKDAEIHDEIFVTTRAIPSRREVLAAIIRSADGNGERLLRNGLLDSQPFVGVVDHFRIVSLNVQDNSGLAEIEVKEMATFQYGKAGPTRLTVRRRVVLSRQEQGWILLAPQDLVYLNRHLAATALTNQLATTSQAPTDHQVKNAVRILHELLSDKSAGASD